MDDDSFDSRKIISDETVELLNEEENPRHVLFLSSDFEQSESDNEEAAAEDDEEVDNNEEAADDSDEAAAADAVVDNEDEPEQPEPAAQMCPQ